MTTLSCGNEQRMHFSSNCVHFIHYEKNVSLISPLLVHFFGSECNPLDLTCVCVCTFHLFASFSSSLLAQETKKTEKTNKKRHVIFCINIHFITHLIFLYWRLIPLSTLYTFVVDLKKKDRFSSNEYAYSEKRR